MKILKESITTISKEGSQFIHKNPEFTDRIKEFENAFEVGANLVMCKSLSEFIMDIEDEKPNFDQEDETYSYYADEFITPRFLIVSYKNYANTLCIEGCVVTTSRGRAYDKETDEAVKKFNINCFNNFLIEIPEDVEDWDAYRNIAHSYVYDDIKELQLTDIVYV